MPNKVKESAPHGSLEEVLSDIRVFIDENRPAGTCTDPEHWIDLVGTYTDYVIISCWRCEKSWQVKYSRDENGAIVWGDAIEVEQVYVKTVPALESAKPGQLGDLFTGDCEPILETKSREDGLIPIRIASPGWGSTGYYSAEVLARDAKIFEGARMFWDHQTDAEEKARPENSLDRLAAVIVTTPEYSETGPVLESGANAGPGVYAYAKPFKQYEDRIKEMAPYIGVSMNGWAKKRTGEAEGKSGKIIEAIHAVASVDFVTVAGAGGAVLEKFAEAARGIPPAAPIEQKPKEEGIPPMEDLNKIQESVRALQEANKATGAENERLRESLRAERQERFVSETVGKAKLPDVSKARIIESFKGQKFALENGDLDSVKLKEAVDAAVTGETAYIASIRETGITGMGDSGEPVKESGSFDNVFGLEPEK